MALTGSAEVALSPGFGVAVNPVLVARARRGGSVQAGLSLTLLCDGAVVATRSADSLAAVFADHEFPLTPAEAAAIAPGGSLHLRFQGRSSAAGAVVQVAELALRLDAPAPPVASGLLLTKLAETSTTITLGWKPVPGCLGYRFTSQGTVRASHTFIPDFRRHNQYPACNTDFPKGRTWYKVEALMPGEVGQYPTPPPVAVYPSPTLYPSQVRP